MQQKTKKERRAYCWKITKNLRDKDEPKLTNLGGKRMNSTKLHSLAGRRQEKQFWERWFATLESREANKEGEGKNQVGTSPRRARQTERATWNTCRQQRVPTNGENRQGLRGSTTEKKKERK